MDDIDSFPQAAPIDSSTRQPCQIDGPARVLLLPDAHIPYHNDEAIGVALDYGFTRNPTHILINGDWMDFYQISDFERDPKKRSVADEIETGTQALRYLRKLAGDRPIIYKIGNHDDRLRRYIWRKAPELAGLPTITIQAMMEFDKHRIKMVASQQTTRVGKLPIFHGHEFRFHFSPVNAARGLWNKTSCSALCSHHHQVSSHPKKNAEGKLLTTWTTGCLCDLTPEWLPHNDWGHGFAIIDVDEHGAYDVQNLRIIEGKVYA